MAKKEVSFEENLEKLEKIVDGLESGETPLKESMSKFKEGSAIIKQCQQELQDAELQVETLVKREKSVTREPFKK